jgi:class 3 adenylate cyclase/pSer/pThr/pTyr-binding forkhead associated (FHA) protein
VSACAACGQRAPDEAAFCPACGARLAGAAASRDEERKVVTVLFCDLAGSTSIGEGLDAESVRGVLSRYFSAMEAVLRRHGGTVEKFIGDAIMAVFGIPVVHEDDALRAVRAAVEMRAELVALNAELDARWGVRLAVRTGINTGEVVAGSSVAGHAFVTGDEVNVAARLEQAAPPGEIYIDADTHRLVRDAVDAKPVAPLSVKGKSQPIPAFTLIDVRPDAPGVARRLNSPLVGREAELALLREAFDDVRRGRHSALASIVGPAGAGKSRLLAEFAGGIVPETRVLTGRCLSYGEGITFWPVAEVVRTAAGINVDDSPDVATTKLADLIASSDDSEEVVTHVAGLLGLGDAASSGSEERWAVSTVLESLAATGPLVVAFDDVQWAEPAFVELIEYLAERLSGACILLVVLARTELVEARPDLLERAGPAIALEPLSAPELRSLIENLLGGGTVADDVLAAVVAAAGGNPLFVEELIHVLVDEGRLRREGDRWTASGEPALTATPPTIHTLIAARVDRLPRGERAVLERASVAGTAFWPAAVRALSQPDARHAVERRLEVLVEKQFVGLAEARLGGERGFAFNHVLVRDVTYQGLLKSARAELHERFAMWLDETAGERAAEYREIVAYHLEQAYRYLVELQAADDRSRGLAARAAAALGSAGERALARGDMHAAVGLLERASSLLGEDEPARRDLGLKLGIALAGTGQLSRVGSLLSEQLDAERRGRAFVVLHDPGHRQRVVYLDTACATVGRRPDNDIALEWDAQVSRSHAELRCDGSEWRLVDGGRSRNGSYVNGQPVHDARVLRDGDVLRFGDTVLLFRGPSPVRRGALTTPEAEGATVLGENPAAAVRLSELERRVLAELRGPAATPLASSTAADDDIAARLSLSDEQVRAVLGGLELKFGVEGPSGVRRREGLLARALSTGVVPEGER